MIKEKSVIYSLYNSCRNVWKSSNLFNFRLIVLELLYFESSSDAFTFQMCFMTSSMCAYMMHTNFTLQIVIHIAKVTRFFPRIIMIDRTTHNGFISM